MLTVQLILEWSRDENLLHCEPSRCYFFLIEKCRTAGEAEFFIFLAKFHRDSMLLFNTSHKMEPWIYGSEGKAFVISDEMFPPTNGFVHAKEVLTGWDLRNTFNYRNPSLIPSSELTKDLGLVELRFHGSPKGTSTEKPMGGSICKNVSDGRTVTSYLFSQKAPFQKQESGSKDSSSITDINEHDSSFIGLKLGRLVDFKDVENNKCPKDTRSSSVTSTVPAKKIRSTCLNGQTPFCQVFGCNMDLSSSKDYHKRHKVCEIHSKTAKVIVNGIEQRFCQQCSRFHLLAEFDDGKRSCRKRLAGHNERRRKPQLDIHSRTGKLLQAYHDAGGNFLGTSLPVMASFLCPDIFPSGILHEIKYGNGEIPSSGQPPMSAAAGQLFPKSFLPHHNTEKQFSSMYNVGNPSGNISYEYRTQIEQSSAGSNFISDSGSNIQDFSGVTVACCAPSLLSSQSRTASSHSASPMAQPLAFQCGQAHYSTTQLPEKPLEVISHTSTSSASEMNSPKDEQMGLLVSSASNTLGFKVQTDVVYEGPQLVSRELLSPEHVDTVNLLQLSILLQSAEEKGLVQAKEECGVFSCLPITEVE